MPPCFRFLPAQGPVFLIDSPAKTIDLIDQSRDLVVEDYCSSPL